MAKLLEMGRESCYILLTAGTDVSGAGKEFKGNSKMGSRFSVFVSIVVALLLMAALIPATAFAVIDAGNSNRVYAARQAIIEQAGTATLKAETAVKAARIAAPASDAASAAAGQAGDPAIAASGSALLSTTAEDTPRPKATQQAAALGWAPGQANGNMLTSSNSILYSPKVTSISAGHGASMAASPNSWSLFNLVCALLAISFALLAAVIYIKHCRDFAAEEHDRAAKALRGEQAWLVGCDDDATERTNRYRGLVLVATAVAAVLLIALFMTTQSLGQPMHIFDVWSAAFDIVTIVGVVIFLLGARKEHGKGRAASPEAGGAE